MQWQWFVYTEPLREPLATAQGVWRSRQGIYLRLQNEQGQIGYGEIAPLPRWGTESLGAAIALCQELPPQLTPEIIAAIPDDLPAAQFGFATAWQSVGRLPYTLGNWPLCGLLSNGSRALQEWHLGWQQGYRTFKWKVGVDSPAHEQAILTELLAQLPAGVTLRLDANGSWDWHTAVQWLRWLDRWPVERIEWVEQPLPAADWESLERLAQGFAIPVALDESVVSWRQLQQWHARQWPGLYVIKPALFGAPARLNHLLAQGLPLTQLVFSSALEGAIARTAIFNLLQIWQPQHALGFGVDRWRPVTLLTSLADYASEWQRLDNYGKNYYK
ncbi:o-succinylbenzoate synthase [Parathermosynechococcus lividus PCC 6715]|uniref:o-succinylbenzoate synthase n=1 Tax=Parathermosynechococcus lividus PCC 6715 TaxID=1917166 RepID=A0A2D2Q3F5_PARLV|nr:o-succinylbenzoate synthase [Thermostichus lividus]ATS19038.1 o-succinylbenzoate synthase [Thermostichus lividus PCC 6715]